MPWSSDLVSELMSSSAHRFVWALECVEIGSAPSAGPYTISTSAAIGDEVCIGLRGIRVAGQRLSPASWSSSIGAFTIEIVGDPRGVFGHFTRGSWVRVLVGIEGVTRTRDMDPVAFGRVANIRGRPPKWEIECWDWTSALRSRNDPANPDLFYSIGTTTSTAALFPFTANVTTAFDVAATGAFERETSGTGLIRVETDAGDTFYLTYSAVPSATRFTVSTSNRFASTQVTFTSLDPSTDTVYECAYLSGHPMTIAAKVLMSRGTGSNGAYDTLPAGWGYGITSIYVDIEDFESWRDRVCVVASGTYNCEVKVEEPQPDGLAWFQSWMQPHGLFFATRQGCATIRCFATDQSIPGDPVAVIKDSDIQPGSVQWECWDSDYTTELYYLTVTSTRHDATPVTTTTISGSTAPVTLPATTTETINLADALWDNSYTDEVQTAVCARLAESRTKVPERVTITVPLRFAQLCPGDMVFLDTTMVYGREDDGLAYDGRKAMVIEVSPDWMTGDCRLGLSVWPTTEREWGA